MTHHVRNILNRNKNNANLSLVSTSTLKNLKRHTKQFNNPSDTRGWCVFLCGFLNLCLTWRMEDSGLGFSSLWGYLLHSILLLRQQIQLGMTPQLHDLSQFREM